MMSLRVVLLLFLVALFCSCAPVKLPQSSGSPSPSASPSASPRPSPRRTPLTSVTPFTIVNADPDQGPRSGGTQVTIVTDGLPTAGRVRVFIGGVPCNVQEVRRNRVGYDEIVCMTGRAPGSIAGVSDIVVYRDTSVSTLFEGFTYENGSLSPSPVLVPSPPPARVGAVRVAQRVNVSGPLANPFQDQPYAIRPTLFTARNQGYLVLPWGERAQMSDAELLRPWIFMLFPSEEGPGQHAFVHIPLEYIRAFVASGYNVFYSRINDVQLGTQYITELRDTHRVRFRALPGPLSEPQINHLWLGGHGNPTELYFSNDHALSLEASAASSVQSREFLELAFGLMVQNLSKVVLFSCQTGVDPRFGGVSLAQGISAVRPNFGVLAPTGDLPEGTVFITDLHQMTLISDQVPFRYFINGAADPGFVISGAAY